MDSNKKKEEDQVREAPFTYEMYAEMPDDGQRYEIIDGILELMSPGASFSHQAVGGELAYILKQSCKSDYLILTAPLDVILSPTNVLQPDVLVVLRSRMHIVTNRGIEGPPDLVVEVLSPSSRKRDKIKKAAAYARFGVEEYWIVDGDNRTLEQYRLDGEGKYELHNLFEGDDVVSSDKLPCVSFRVSDLFVDVID